MHVPQPLSVPLYIVLPVPASYVHLYYFCLEPVRHQLVRYQLVRYQPRLADSAHS
jgi:hypothetical protein